jgi:hypothetical protein
LGMTKIVSVPVGMGETSEVIGKCLYPDFFVGTGTKVPVFQRLAGNVINDSIGFDIVG